MEQNDMARREAENRRILALLSVYLTERPTFVQREMLEELTACGVTQAAAYALLLAAAMGLDVEGDAVDRALYHAYFPDMLHCLRARDCKKNPYYADVRFRAAALGDCTLEMCAYAPFEAFVCDDVKCFPDGRRVPQIGYFESEFRYPAMLEHGRLWMSVTPNEVNTMEAPVAAARGRVLAFGLGLGYFPYMASQRAEVTEITVVEQNPAVIALFCQCLLPQFPHREKIHIVQDDAFAYAARCFGKDRFDFTFTDLWHDVSDGLPLYLRMRELAARAPETEHAYWIEKTMRCYLDE